MVIALENEPDSTGKWCPMYQYYLHMHIHTSGVNGSYPPAIFGDGLPLGVNHQLRSTCAVR